MIPHLLQRPLARLRDLLSPAPVAPITLQEALPRLLPKVRPRFLHEALPLLAGQPGPEFQPLAGIFAVSLVVDLPDRELDVGRAELERWDAGFEPLLQRARANLAGRSGTDDFEAMAPGCYRSTWRDNLDGSRVLLPGLLRQLPLRGDPVVLLPNRDTLLVAGAEDPEAMERALEGVLGFLAEDPHALNGCPLRLRNFQWETFQAGAEHRFHRLLARVRNHRLHQEYGSQKHLLDRRHGLAGVAITVAPFHLEAVPDGPVRSFTEWSGAMGEAWLPWADQVRLSWTRGRERGRAWVPWERLQARPDPLLVPVGLFPERYRFAAPPDPDRLESLVS